MVSIVETRAENCTLQPSRHHYTKYALTSQRLLHIYILYMDRYVGRYRVPFRKTIDLQMGCINIVPRSATAAMSGDKTFGVSPPPPQSRPSRRVGDVALYDDVDSRRLNTSTYSIPTYRYIYRMRRGINRRKAEEKIKVK